MKRILCWVLMMGGISRGVQGQQNLFNIPSGDITPRKKIFFQQQINFNRPDRFSAKSHFVAGLGRNWEAGVNVVNSYFDFRARPSFIISTPFNSKEPYPYYPLLLFTGQKRWEAGRRLFFNVGTQTGVNLYRSVRGKRLTHFSYGLAGLADKEKHRWKVVAGPYLTDWRFVGGGADAGVMAGTEIKLSKKFLFMMDFISGNHKNGVTVAGFTYNVKSNFQVCLGWQFPNPASPEKPALVLEINLFNF